MSSVAPERVAGNPLYMLPRKRWWFVRCLRGQLTVLNTLVILGFTVILWIGLHRGLFYMLLWEQDRLLNEDIDEVGLMMDQFFHHPELLRDDLKRKADSHAHHKWFAKILDPQGNVFLKTERIPDIVCPAMAEATSSIKTVENFRVLQRRYTTPSGISFVIEVGASTDAIRSVVDRLTELMVVAGGTLLIVAPMVGFWLASRAIRPLARIIQTTANLRPRRLDERLPLRHTGDQLDQLSATINGFLNRIADYLAHHHDLLANVAHELRSPIAAIRSSTEVALKQDRTPEEYRDRLETIIEECSRLGTLVNQLLLLAESDAGRLERIHDPVQLDRLVRKAIEMFQGVAESRGVELKAEPLEEAWVSGDAGQLRQVVLNLIDNGIKFAGGGSVTISVSRDEGNGLAQLTVKDTGPGIDPEHLPHIFERFYRGGKSPTRSERPGSGLGLSICQALVEAHGGTIRVESRLGQGTEMIVALPSRPR